MRKATFRLFLVLAALGRPVRAQDEVYYKVGPGGDYATIQAALTRAAQSATSPGEIASHRILVQSGTYLENLRLPAGCCGPRWIKVSGGWNATFTGQDTDPTATVIDGRDRGRVLDASMSSGTLVLERLVLRKGRLATGPSGFANGAGLRSSLSGTASLHLSLVHVRDNAIHGDRPGNAEAQGAGASVLLLDTARLRVYMSRFENNLTVPHEATFASFGGGLNVQGEDESRVTVLRTDFVGNWAYGSRISEGGGMYATVERGRGESLLVEDSLFQGNVVHNAIGSGAGLQLRTFEGEIDSTSRVSRCRFVSHLVGRSQLGVSAAAHTRADVSDSLVAKGRGGVDVIANGGTAHLTNLTVADNQLQGIRGSETDGGQLTVSNSIAYGNDGGELALGAGVSEGSNLTAIDPRFVPGSYQLGGGSPAADAGRDSPPAGLGLLDLARRPRVYNANVDIGAYEWFPF